MWGYGGGSLIGQSVSFRHPEDGQEEIAGRVTDEHDDGTVTVEYVPSGEDPAYGRDEVRLPHGDVDVDMP